MKRGLVTAILLTALLTSPLSAAGGPLRSLPLSTEGAGVTTVAFDGSSPGSHHRRAARAGASPKSVAPALPDLHGATREEADKAYRQKYGF